MSMIETNRNRLQFVVKIRQNFIINRDYSFPTQCCHRILLTNVNSISNNIIPLLDKLDMNENICFQYYLDDRPHVLHAFEVKTKS